MSYRSDSRTQWLLHRIIVVVLSLIAFWRWENYWNYTKATPRFNLIQNNPNTIDDVIVVDPLLFKRTSPIKHDKHLHFVRWLSAFVISSRLTYWRRQHRQHRPGHNNNEHPNMGCCCCQTRNLICRNPLPFSISTRNSDVIVTRCVLLRWLFEISCGPCVLIVFGMRARVCLYSRMSCERFADGEIETLRRLAASVYARNNADPKTASLLTPDI